MKRERRVVAFVVRPDRPIEQIDLGPVAPIAQAIDAWRVAFVADRSSDQSSVGRGSHDPAGAATKGLPVAAPARRLCGQAAARKRGDVRSEPVARSETGHNGERRRAAGESPQAAGKPPMADPAGELRRLIWDRLEPHLTGVRTVLVSPDGALARFPFAALPGKKAGTYLIEERLIAVVPVPQMLPELLPEGGEQRAEGQKDQAVSKTSLLLVGDVDFGADAGALVAATRGTAPAVSGDGSSAADYHRAAPRGGSRTQYGRLDATRSEILAVTDTFQRTYRGGSVLQLRDAEASEPAVRQAAPHYRYIHLATHGFFAPAELKSALAPLDRPSGRDQFGAGGDVVGWHPGLLSGIALAGANRQTDPERDDGILTALEMASLDLSGTELIVFSACETGLGQTAGGEGLLGIQRACQVAGARTAVASLWKVPDVATQSLMARFYENLWRKKMPKLEALRDAQLALLRGELGRGPGAIVERPEAGPYRAPPHIWAAWVLSGDWR